MRKTLALVATLLILPSLGWGAATILVPERTWDFGIAHKSGQLSHPYWIKNGGDDTLKIDVKPG